jgi:acylphosphatase
MAADGVRLTARVSGVVQGVGFRYWTARKADELLLTGTVRNLADGTVELVAEGPRQDIDRILDWLNSSNAPGRVEHVDSDLSEATGEFAGFGITG